MATNDAMLVALTREARIVNAASRACDTSVRLEISGMGLARARVAAQRQVAAGATSLTSVGFAGALRAPLRVGDLTLPREVIDSSGQRFAVDPNMHGQLSRALCAPFHVHQGALASVDHVVDEVVRKGTLARVFDVDAVDMESAAIARVAHDAGLPFAVLRVICDGPRQGIPRCTEGAADARGRVIVARLASALALRPWELLALLRLGTATVRASRVLEHALCTVFDEARAAVK